MQLELSDYLTAITEHISLYDETSENVFDEPTNKYN